MKVYTKIHAAMRQELNDCNLCKVGRLGIYSTARHGFLWVRIACDCGNQCKQIIDVELNISTILGDVIKQWNKENDRSNNVN